MSAQIGITREFRERMQRMDGQVQAEIWEAASKVLDGNPSVHVHKLKACDYVSFSVSRNALRVICLREDGALLLVHVGAHDPAYLWARRNRACRVGNVIRIVPMEVETIDAPPAPGDGLVEAPGPLAHLRDRQFINFEVSPGFAEVLRRVPSEKALLELATHIVPPPLADALLELAFDPDGLDQATLGFQNALRSWQAGQQQPTPTLAAALANPLNASTMMVLPPGERALQTALRGDLEDWRLFLHPSQQRMVRWRGTGAMKLIGGPGTGKTVVALHRARYLAEARFADDPRPVLLTTFGATLAEQLRDLIRSLCADRPELLERIEVLTLTGVAQRLLRDADRPAAFLSSQDLEPCWKDALFHDQLGWSRATYQAEREHVLCQHDAWTEADYFKARRTGRSTKIDRAARRKVWAVLSGYEAALARLGGGDAEALAREATRVLDGEALDNEALQSPWSAVVCDEIQDASALELRLLGAITRDAETGKCRPDALFLCGDGYQRLYRSGVPLSHCGIDIRGRSRTLRLNYRTTEGIRRAAVEVVNGVDIDDLDAVAQDDLPSLQGYRSLRAGPLPVVRELDSLDAEADWIAQLGSESAAPLLVLARTKKYRDELGERLRDRGLGLLVLEGSGDVAPAGLTLCTLHRCKGLEAPRVVIVGRQLLPLRWPGGDPADKAAWQRQERCLLYVGMTRARDWCGVSSVMARAVDTPPSRP